MTHRERTDEIAREAAAAARRAAEEAQAPEARHFLRQHAMRLERIAAARRRAARIAERGARVLAAMPVAVLPEGF